MALFSAGSNLTYNIAPFVLNVITTVVLAYFHLRFFPNALFSARYFSSYALPLLVSSSLSFPVTITFMQITLSSSFPSTH